MSTGKKKWVWMKVHEWDEIETKMKVEKRTMKMRKLGLIGIEMQWRFCFYREKRKT